jgi:hypothetical protein
MSKQVGTLLAQHLKGTCLFNEKTAVILSSQLFQAQSTSWLKYLRHRQRNDSRWEVVAQQ